MFNNDYALYTKQRLPTLSNDPKNLERRAALEKRMKELELRFNNDPATAFYKPYRKPNNPLQKLLTKKMLLKEKWISFAEQIIKLHNPNAYLKEKHLPSPNPMHKMRKQSESETSIPSKTQKVVSFGPEPTHTYVYKVTNPTIPISHPYIYI